MAEQQIEVFTSLLEGRAPDLAGEKDPEQIKAIVQETADRAKAINPKDNDVWIYRGTVIVLGIVAIVVAIAQFKLALDATGGSGEPKIPEGLVAIGAAAIGALAGLLAPTSGR